MIIVIIFKPGFLNEQNIHNDQIDIMMCIGNVWVKLKGAC